MPRERPAVERRHPPTALVRLVNPLVRRLVARGVAADQLLLLHLTGRRTGRAYDIPVGYHLHDGVPTVLTDSAWRVNLRGGQDVQVTLRGVRRPARADLVEDVDAVTDVYAERFAALGWKAAQRRLGLRVHAGRAPTRDELAEVVRRTGLSVIRLSGAGEP